MLPIITGSNYNKLAEWWHSLHNTSEYGVSMLEKAISFCGDKSTALDAGCGSGGRFIRVMEKHGFKVTGIDLSDEMIRIATANHPNHYFFVQDICEFETDMTFDLITAWDSIFHLPLSAHKIALQKMCRLLAPGGVLIYTLGDDIGEHTDTMQEIPFYYSSIGINANLQILIECGLTVRHLELDQLPEKHVCVIAVKDKAMSPPPFLEFNLP
ncbi:MAG: trans-aconitate 2-methyltransferase [Deferribacterales bacterium]